jgi:predicted PurR-regulated permease PerM
MAKLTPVRREPSSPDGSQTKTPDTLDVRLPVRNVALTILVVLAIIFTLRLAKDVFLPIALGLLLSYALSPIVARMAQWRVPASISAALLLIALTIGLGASVYLFADQIAAIVNRIPEAARNVAQSIREQRQTGGTIQQLQKAATELEKAAKEVTGETKAINVAPATPLKDIGFNLHSYLLSGTLGMMAVLTQIVIVLFLTYFLLASGDLFKRKLVKIGGTTLSDKRITFDVLSGIDNLIGRFLLLQLAISIVVGVVSWLFLQWIGVEQALLWGIMSAAATWIPYLGPAVITMLIMLVAYLQFQTLGITLLIGAVLVGIRTVEGMLLVPWLTGRIANMNAVAMFISLLFWGWIWGAWGVFLAAPIMMSLKVVCDHIRELQGFAELLSD